MNELFSYTKLFTICLTISYICGLICEFYQFQFLMSFIIFILLSLIVFFLKVDFKKILILFLIFFLGIIRAQNSNNLEERLDNINSNNAQIEGQIITSKDISIKNNKIKFFLKAKNATIDNEKYENLNTKILISIDNLNDISQKIEIGDYIELKGKLRTPNPSSNPHQFNYENYLLNHDTKNILYGDYETLKVIKKPKISKDFNDSWFYILKQFENTRNKILEKHSKNIKSPKLEILGGIVFGNETINPDEEIKENFKNSGLLHLLAASGLNVALIYGIWWWLASLLRFPYYLSISIGAIFVILYTFMTGFPPSILRASIMLLFVLFGKIIDRNANSVALIFFVGFLILLFNPKMIFDVGFQLSFVVTIGLVACCPVIISKFDKIDEKFKEKYKNLSRFQKYFLFLFSPKSIAGIICVPLIAQIFVIPLQMHYFNNFAPFSLLANIAVVPFIGVLSFIGFVGSIIALIPVLNEPIIYLFDLIANPLLGLLIKISQIFSSFKNSLLMVFGLNAFQILIYWIFIFLFVWNLKNNFKNKIQKISLLILVLIFLLSFIKIDNFKNNLEIIMFDVENADCFLIKTPKKHYIMIDTGKKSYKSSTSAELIINKYLKNERINSLDALIITHYDLDHSSGTIDILKTTKVKNIILQNDYDNSNIAKSILDYLKSNKINYKIAKNDEIILKEKDLYFKTYTPKGKTENEQSIVALLNYKDKNILFMADCGISGFKTIEKYFNKVDVIKVGHHGARNSIDEEMIKKLSPKFALISAGSNNFDHPHYKTIDILDKFNTQTISTKYQGFTKLIFNKNKIDIYNFDTDKQKLKLTEFKKLQNDFHKSKFFQEFIKNNQ